MNLRSIREPGLKEIFDALEEAFLTVGIDYYLIGAQARDVWFSQAGMTPRQTNDVDFAVLVGSVTDYNAAREYLSKHKQFSETTTNSFVMLTENGAQVDILPFGGIEIDETVTVQGEGLSSIRVNGFMEVYESGTEQMETTTGHQFYVASLPAIVLLKLIAYDDRPENRDKDASDIAGILDYFFDMQSDMIFEHHNDLFTEKVGLSDISAMVIGREIKKIIQFNAELISRINTILQGHVEKRENSAFIRMMLVNENDTVDSRIRLLEHLLKGLQTSST